MTILTSFRTHIWKQVALFFMCLVLFACLANRAYKTLDSADCTIGRSSNDCIFDHEPSSFELQFDLTTALKAPTQIVVNGPTEKLITFDITPFEGERVMAALTFARDQGGVLPVSNVVLKAGDDTFSQVNLVVENRSLISLYQDSHRVWSQKWHTKVIPILQDSAQNFSLLADGRVTNVSLSFQFQTIKIEWYFFLLTGAMGLIIAFLFGYSLSSLMPRSNALSLERSRSSIFLIISTSTIITLTSLIAGRLGLYGPSDVFAKDGFSYASRFRFSDFIDVFNLSMSSSPYTLGGTNYPPAFLAFLRLTHMQHWGFLFVLSILLSIAGVFVLTRWIFDKFSFGTVFSVFVVFLSSYPVLFAIDRGSTDFLILPLLILFVLLVRSHHWNSASLLLGVLCALKIYPLFFLPLLLISRRRLRSLLLCINSGIGTTLIAAVILPESNLTEIKAFVLSTVDRGNIFTINPGLSARNLSVSSWPYQLASIGGERQGLGTFDSLLSVLTLLLIFSILAVTFMIARRNRSSVSGLTLTLTLAMLILFPLSNDYRLMLLFPALVLFVLDEQLPGKGWLFLISSGFLLSARPLVYFGDSPQVLGSWFSLPLLLFLLISCGQPRSRCSSNCFQQEQGQTHKVGSGHTFVPSAMEEKGL